MSKLEECQQLIKSYLASQEKKGEPITRVWSSPMKVNNEVKYLMAQQYIEGFNAGVASVLELIPLPKE